MVGIWQVNENDGFFLSPSKDSNKWQQKVTAKSGRWVT
jgi:hypothetical protein